MGSAGNYSYHTNFRAFQWQSIAVYARKYFNNSQFSLQFVMLLAQQKRESLISMLPLPLKTFEWVSVIHSLKRWRHTTNFHDYYYGISYFRQTTQPHRQIHHGAFDCRVKYFIATDTSGIIRYDSYHFDTLSLIIVVTSFAILSFWFLKLNTSRTSIL